MLRQHSFYFVVEGELLERGEVVQEVGVSGPALQDNIMDVEEREQAHQELAVHPIGDAAVPGYRIGPIL